MFFWVTVPSLSFPLWEDEVMEKIGKALGKFIGFIEVRKTEYAIIHYYYSKVLSVILLGLGLPYFP